MRCSITSKSSPPASGNAQSADSHRRGAAWENFFEKLAAQPHHQSHHPVWIYLCTTCRPTREDLWSPSTTPHRPQLRPPARPVVHRPSTASHGPWRARTPAHPQNAQPLILLLISLPGFFSKTGAWGRNAAQPAGRARAPACRRRGLAFKMRAKALRLVFDRGYGRRDGGKGRLDVKGGSR